MLVPIRGYDAETLKEQIQKQVLKQILPRNRRRFQVMIIWIENQACRVVENVLAKLKCLKRLADVITN